MRKYDMYVREGDGNRKLIHYERKDFDSDEKAETWAKEHAMYWWPVPEGM